MTRELCFDFRWLGTDSQKTPGVGRGSATHCEGSHDSACCGQPELLWSPVQSSSAEPTEASHKGSASGSSTLGFRGLLGKGKHSEPFPQTLMKKHPPLLFLSQKHKTSIKPFEEEPVPGTDSAGAVAGKRHFLPYLSCCLCFGFSFWLPC